MYLAVKVILAHAVNVSAGGRYGLGVFSVRDRRSNNFDHSSAHMIQEIASVVSFGVFSPATRC